jgi:ankyrin repeat protein
LEIVKVLIEHGAQIDKASNDGETPFLIAATYGFNEVVKVHILIKQKMMEQQNMDTWRQQLMHQ